MTGTVATAPQPGVAGMDASSRVPVLMYHRIEARIVAAEHRYCVSARQFAAHLDWLEAHGYRPCSIAAFDRWFHGLAPLPPKSVLITFDDGFAGLHAHALPLLAARGWPATVFLVSALIGRSDRWSASEFGVTGSHALLHLAQIAEMARHGIEFQSHSRTHADLSTLDERGLADEVGGSRRELEDMLGTAVDYFAVPYGRFDARVADAVRAAGFRLAFSVNPGFNRPGVEPYAVRRLDVTGRDTMRRFGRMVELGTNDGSLTQQLRYIGRRLAARLPARI